MAQALLALIGVVLLLLAGVGVTPRRVSLPLLAAAALATAVCWPYLAAAFN